MKSITSENTVRRTLIQYVLPLAFVLVPLLGAVLVFAAIPNAARAYYFQRIQTSGIDLLILGLGGILFATQSLLAFRALQWRGDGFDERPDPWLSHLAQAAEWFPLLGLIGTVAAILVTFSDFPLDKQPDAATIIRSYGPAITATGSGLFMALINILPTWTALVGRDLIRSLAGSGDPERKGSP